MSEWNVYNVRKDTKRDVWIAWMAWEYPHVCPEFEGQTQCAAIAALKKEYPDAKHVGSRRKDDPNV